MGRREDIGCECRLSTLASESSVNEALWVEAEKDSHELNTV